MSELHQWLEYAITHNATDLHMTSGKVPRVRIDGRLVSTNGTKPADMGRLVEDILTMLPEGERENRRKTWDGGEDVDCAFSFEDKARVRTNIFRTSKGIAVALRIIPNKRLTAQEIGIPLAVIEMCKQKGGLFIITGANGTGKTSTLAALMDVINDTRSVHILTIEDPIEYQMEDKKSWFSQREIGQHVNEFYKALRSAVRENPDIVMLGEMRDLNTTRTALELAETGHLVFATLHTRSALASIDRIIGQFPSGEQNQIRLMLSESLLGILAQTLLPRKNGGLIAAFELLLPDTGIRNAIKDPSKSNVNAIMRNAMQTGSQHGMMTMEQSIRRLVNEGIVDVADVPADYVLKDK